MPKEMHPKPPANNKRLYGQNAAVALKYNPDLTLNRAQIDALDWRE